MSGVETPKAPAVVVPTVVSEKVVEKKPAVVSEKLVEKEPDPLHVAFLTIVILYFMLVLVEKYTNLSKFGMGIAVLVMGYVSYQMSCSLLKMPRK